MKRCLLSAVPMLIAAAMLTGCDAISHITTSIVPDKPVDSPEAMVYPDDLEVGETLDVRVVRVDRRHVRFDNRTTTVMQNVTIYLNHEYGAVLDELPIGDSGPLPLLQFVNQHAERFPVGSFLEPEKAKVLLLADAVIDGKLRKLNVRLEKEWDRP